MSPTGARQVAVALTIAAGLATGCFGRATTAFGAGAHRAAVIVDTGAVVQRVVITFDEPSISGIEALERAGAQPLVRGYGSLGAAVCSLYGVGHPANADCLGSASDPRFWSYWRATNGATKFTLSGVGAGSTQVKDGDVEGWRWGTGGTAPPFTSVAELAGDPPPSTTATPASAGTAPTTPAATPGASLGGPATGGTSEATSTGAAATPTDDDRVSTSGSPAAAGRDADRASAAPNRVADASSGSPVPFFAFAGVLTALAAVVAAAHRARRRAASDEGR